MKKKTKTRGPTDMELREFVSWCANYGDGLREDVIDYKRLGETAKQRAKKLLAPRCTECNQTYYGDKK